MNLSRRTMVLAGSALPGPGLARRGFAQTGESVRVVQPWDTRGLRPSESGFAATRAGWAETLVRCEVDGTLTAGLAERWSVSEDGLTWRFSLRQGLRFHDDTPVLAASVAASYTRLLPGSLYLRLAGIGAVEPDGGDVVFRLRAPFGPFLAYLIDNSAPILAPAAFDAQDAVVRPIGTGPFRVAAMDLPRGLVLVRNREYWGEQPRFETLRYDAVGNAETRANIALAGDAELVMNIPATAVQRVERGGLMRVDRQVIPRVHNLLLNVALPQFADKRVRQALSLAIDRAAVAAGIMRNPALAATQYLPASLKAWRFTDLVPLRHDVAAGNALLDSAGWPRGADGIRTRDGERFAGTLRTFANRPELPIIATALQQQFRAVGFDLAVTVGDFSAIVEGQRDGTLQLGLTSRSVTIVPDPVSTLGADFCTDMPPPGAGQTNWRHAGIRSAMADYTASADEVTKSALRRIIAGNLQDELPVIPIVWYDQIIAVSNRLDGFVSDPFEQRLALERVRLG